MTHVLQFFNPTASAMVYGRRPKFFRAEHSATAEGENCAYGPTLIFIKHKLFIAHMGNANGNWWHIHSHFGITCLHLRSSYYVAHTISSVGP